MAPRPAQAPRYGSMGMGAVMTVFLGVAIGSLVALFFRGGLQASGRRAASMSSLFFSSEGAGGAYQRSQAQQFLRSMEDASGALAPSASGLAAAGAEGAAGTAAGALAAEEGAGGLPPAAALPAGAGAGCDCEACTALLDALGLDAPAHWGDAGVGECECGTCTALMRLSLQAQGITSLEVNRGFLAGAFGDVRSLLLRMQALSARPAAPCPACACASGAASDAASAATTAGGAAAPCAPCSAAAECRPAAEGAAGAAAAAAAPKPCPPPQPCPAAPQCSPEGVQGGGGPASPPSPLYAQLSAANGAPVWSAARALRGVPAPPCSVAHAYGPLHASACQQTAIALPTRCVVGRHEDHWRFFVNMVTATRAPMALMRYVDGERMIMQGTPVGTSTQAWGEDKWQWEGGDSRMARDMAAGLRGHYGEPVFYAFASPQDDEHGLRYYLDRTEGTCGQITYANLWINGYYHRTKAMLLNLLATQHTRIVLIANHEGLTAYPPCAPTHAAPLAGCIPVPDNAVHAWEEDASRGALLDPALALASSLPPGSLFIVCAGPLSKPLISALWKANKAHQYIDFGSAMDETLKGRRTRPYMDAASPYARGVDPQWACHRGPAGAAFNVSRPADSDFAEGRCFTFSTPEGE